jgi:hypothetical protein
MITLRAMMLQLASMIKFRVSTGRCNEGKTWISPKLGSFTNLLRASSVRLGFVKFVGFLPEFFSKKKEIKKLGFGSFLS